MIGRYRGHSKLLTALKRSTVPSGGAFKITDYVVVPSAFGLVCESVQTSCPVAMSPGLSLNTFTVIIIIS